MFLVKASASLATCLGGTDEKEKEKAYACTNKSDIRHFILMAQLVLLLFPEPGCAMLDCQLNTSNVSSPLIPLRSYQNSCKVDPHSKVNISLTSPWLECPAGICSDLSWRHALQLSMHNISSNFSVRIQCNKLNNAVNKLETISEFYGAFSSAVGSFDCRQRYSVKKNCTQCLNAYKRWLCLVQFFTTGLKPCLDICYDVYRNCPAFQPEESYGGYHVFECPKEGDLFSSYGPKSNCTTGTSST